MKTNKRWINKTIQAAAQCDVKLPWERGATREAFIARRTNEDGTSMNISLAPMPSWMMEAISA